MKKLYFLQIIFLSALLMIPSCGSGPGGSGNNSGLGIPGVIAAVHWAKSFGGASGDSAFFNVVQQTSDGGYIVIADTSSFGAGNSDIWIIKLNSDGSIDWQRSYGGNIFEDARFIQQTLDGGYIVGGNTTSLGPVSGVNYFWVVKLDSVGGITWQKTYGSPLGADTANSIHQKSNGQYVVAGLTSSFGAGGNDVYIIAIDTDGSILWQRTYGGTNSDRAMSIRQTSDLGYIVAGYTTSFGSGGNDFLVFKLNASGGIVWQKVYGGAGDDYANSVKQTSDGGYIIAGQTDSMGAGGTDILVIKLKADESIDWQKTYGGTNNESAYSIEQTSDGGYIVAGESDSAGAGNTDIILLKLDSSGNVTWQKSYGGTGVEKGYSVAQTSDGGYVVSGQTQSYGAGSSDSWILRLKSDGTISDSSPSNIGADVTLTSQVAAVTVNDITLNVSVPSGAINISTATVSNTSATIMTQASD